MRKIQFFLALFCCVSGLLLSSGCSSPQYAALPVLPDYHQSLRTYRTDARILVRSCPGNTLDKQFTEMLTQRKYRVVTEPNPQKPVDWVIQPLEIRYFGREQAAGTYLDTRILLQVRNPGIVQKDIFRYTKSRYFQAWDRTFLGKKRMETAELDRLKRQAVRNAAENLFHTNEFLKALEPDPFFRNIYLPQLRKAERGDLRAQQHLQNYHFKDSVCFPADPFQSFRWTLNAGQRNNLGWYSSQVFYAIGHGLLTDPVFTQYLVRQLAEQGSAEAQHYMGRTYHYSFDNVPADPQKAVYWYRKAAAQNYTSAMNNLAIMLIDGDRIPANPAEGMALLERAAKLGNVTAQYNLGYYYDPKHRSTTPDLAKAYYWYKTAAQHGHQAAAKALKRLQEKNIQ